MSCIALPYYTGIVNDCVLREGGEPRPRDYCEDVGKLSNKLAIVMCIGVYMIVFQFLRCIWLGCKNYMLNVLQMPTASRSSTNFNGVHACDLAGAKQSRARWISLKTLLVCAPHPCTCPCYNIDFAHDLVYIAISLLSRNGKGRVFQKQAMCRLVAWQTIRSINVTHS
jgi:hypothetical protein